jgi:DNA polymerase III subunit chi
LTEILFYHLTETTLEQSLPGLLEKCLERGWRVVLQSGSQERLETLDGHLWTWREESFLPHTMIRDGSEAEQPIWLTVEQDNPNGANIRFMIDHADPPDLSGYLRGIYLFDGHDMGAVEHARTRWKAEKSAGHEVTYWQQNTRGGWDKKA